MDIRRLVVICILLALLVGCFAACSDGPGDPYDERVIENLGFCDIEYLGEYGDWNSYLACDPYTGVEYFIVDGHYAFTISPRYDSDGKVIVREVK